jgi:GxxExxY protein
MNLATDLHGLNTDNLNLLYEKTTKSIIGAAFDVYNELGYGFLERVYQRALQIELIQRGHKVEIEYAINVKYKNIIVGEYKADLFVDAKIIIELKVSKNYNSEDEPQLLNELKATDIKVGLLINFGREKVEFKRFIY